MDCKKSNKITEIVRLQQILKKWRKIANSSKTSSSSIPANNNNNNTSGSKSIKFLKRTLSLSESSGAGGRGGSPVPKGFLAVSVGEEQKRFTIPTEYLSHSAFHILLREAEEEFGFQQAGILRIPCEVAVFESVLRIVEDKKDVYFKFSVEDGVVGGYGYCLLTGQQTPTHHPQSPMCR
ncbi:Auxin-responsive protein SAUR32 [Linum grandiflorum]